MSNSSNIYPLYLHTLRIFLVEALPWLRKNGLAIEIFPILMITENPFCDEKGYKLTLRAVTQLAKFEREEGLFLFQKKKKSSYDLESSSLHPFFWPANYLFSEFWRG